jgi:hypothetical protein
MHVALQKLFSFTNAELMKFFREEERYKEVFMEINVEFAEWLLSTFTLDLDIIKEVYDKEIGLENIGLESEVYKLFRKEYEKRI